MKTRNILITIGVATLATITISAFGGDGPFLSPRAAGNQIKRVAGTNNDPNLIDTWHAEVVTPRAAGNQTAKTSGTSNEVNPATVCAKTMGGTPKAIQACVEHPATMPGCNTAMVAPLK